MTAARARLIIVDQSLRDMDGHHYEYDLSIARAAQRAGYAVSVIANQDCARDLAMGGVPLLPYFRRAWTEAHLGPSAHLARALLSWLPPTLRQPLIVAASRLRRKLRGTAATIALTPPPQRPLPSFGAELAALLDRDPPAPADHVLIHTLGNAELHALIEALGTRAALPVVHVILRRDADEPDVRQDSWGGISGAFTRVAANPELAARLRFYGDTEHLVQQYAAIDPCIRVREAPIPHGLPDAGLPARHGEGGPLCFTYLGNARTEKGYHHLAAAVAALAPRELAAGRIRFVIQSNSNLSLEEPVIAAARQTLSRLGDGVELLREALDLEQFQARLLEADIVVLPYIAALYRRRSSGILVQAIACGRPVVVPSGTWLADAAPPGTAVTFDGPADLPRALVAAAENARNLQAAASAAAADWRSRHNADAFLAALLEHTPGGRP